MHALVIILSILHIHGMLAGTIIRDVSLGEKYAPVVIKDTKIAIKAAKKVEAAWKSRRNSTSNKK